MKNKRFLTLILWIVFAILLFGNNSVYAAETKVATVNNLSVSFKNGKAKEIQCLQIEGKEYINIHMVADNMEFELYPIYGNKGVMLDPFNKPVEKATTKKLNQRVVNVAIVPGQIIYDGTPLMNVEMIMYQGQYWFKLHDIERAAKQCEQIWIELTTLQANGDIATGPFVNIFPSVNISKKGNQVSVTQEDVNLKKIFDDIRAAKNPNNKTDKPSVQKPAKKEKSIDAEEYIAEVVRLVNVERKKTGVKSLKVDVILTNAAKIRAEEVTSVFSHTRPNGTKWSTAVKEQGGRFSYMGENLAGSYGSPESVVKAWMDSDGHRRNILSPEYKSIGVAIDLNSYGRPSSWVQIFAD